MGPAVFVDLASDSSEEKSTPSPQHCYSNLNGDRSALCLISEDSPKESRHEDGKTTMSIKHADTTSNHVTPSSNSSMVSSLPLTPEQQQRVALNRAAAIRRRLAAGRFPCKAATDELAARADPADVAGVATELARRSADVTVSGDDSMQRVSAQSHESRDQGRATVAGRGGVGDGVQTGEVEENPWRTVKKRKSFSEDESDLILAASTGAANSASLSAASGWSKLEGLPPPYVPRYSTAAAQAQQGKPSSNGGGESNLHKVQQQLSEQQLRVLQAVAQQRSVFVTGCAGTGKSFLLEVAIRQLRAMYGADKVHITASTGLAACSLGGTTLHSFAGVGLGTGSRESLAEKVMSRKETRNRWRSAKALVVDEISMVDGHFFDTLDFIGQVVRQRREPFGGLQLLVSGDFYQLPPVTKGRSDKNFAFDASCWDTCFDLQVQLTRVFRQADGDFVSILNEIREGRCGAEAKARLMGQMDARIDAADGVELTKLYPYKVDVARENHERLQALQQCQLVFEAKDEARSDFALRLLENTRAAKELPLCIGAQVMLIKNLDPSAGLANGSRGVVVGFSPPDLPVAAQWKHLVPAVHPSGMWPVVRFACDGMERVVGPESWSVEEGGREVAKRWQVPLALAWALSVHKCQGMTLDRVETDLSRAFDYGMVYVALSRVRSLEGLCLLGFDAKKIKIHPKVQDFYHRIAENASEYHS